jgi:hypothetical protein
MEQNRKSGKLILPGDPEFNNDKYKGYLWNTLRKQLGLEPEKKVRLEIHGFIINDLRTKPHVSIWKNCKIRMEVGFKPPLTTEPIPFQYYEEAMDYIKKMHLSMEDSKKVVVSALCPEPGLGHARPDTIIMTKDELKGR